jgi:hypothetical protein
MDQADLVARVGRMKLAGPDMLIDGYEQYNQQENEVVNITPDDGSDEPAEASLRADDCKTILLTPSCSR